MKPYRLFALMVILLAPAVQAQHAPGLPGPVLPQALVQARRALNPPARAAKTEERLEKRTTLTWDRQGAAGWLNDARTVYTYDAAGYLDDETSYAWNGTEWVPTTRTDYAFTDGLLEIERHDAWTGTAWQIVEAYTYTYTMGGISDVLLQDWVDGRWRDRERIHYTGGAYITGGQRDTMSTAGWVHADRFDLTAYGVNDGGISYRGQAWNGAEWVNTERLDFPGTTHQQLYDLFFRHSGAASELEGSILSARLPDAVAFEWDGAQWVQTGRQRSETFYDMITGALLKTELTFDAWIDSAWVSEARLDVNHETLAGNQSRPDTTRLQIFDGETWFPLLEETYFYTESGALRRIYQRLDFGLGLQNATLIELEWKGIVTSVDGGETLPERYRLDAAYPNPFNPATRLGYHLTAPGRVAIRVYDALGRVVTTLVDGQQAAGSYEVTFEAAGLPSGVYLVRLEAPGLQQTRTVTLLK